MAPVPISAQQANEDDRNVLISLTRLEAKVDVALAQQTAAILKHGEDLDDHEGRLREVERRKYVAPSALWAAVGSVIVAFGVLAPYLGQIIAAAGA